MKIKAQKTSSPLLTPKEFIYDKVFNGEFSTTYDFIVFSTYDRATLNEGGVVIDTDNKIVYMYCDLTSKVDMSASGNYYVFNTSPIFPYTTYRPKGMSNMTINGATICQERVTSVSGSPSLVYNTWKFCYYASNYIGLMTDAAAVKKGERYIVYSMWQYDYV